MASPIDELLNLPGSTGDAARTAYATAPLPGEMPADTDQRVATQQAIQAQSDAIQARAAQQQADQQARQDEQQARATKADLTQRNIPFFTDDSGKVKPITDETGAALTDYDHAHRTAYDSAGNLKQIQFGEFGPPKLVDPFAAAPTTTDDVTGDQYKKVPGQPWQWVGRDPAVAQKRLRAKDLAQRGIPTYLDDTGSTQPVTDATGAPLTNFDKPANVAYDSSGNPVQIKYGLTGPPVVEDAMTGVGVTTDDKTGAQYKIRRGLPWEYVGTDPAIEAKNNEKAKQDAVAKAAQDAGRLLTIDERQNTRDGVDLIAKKKELANLVPTITDHIVAGEPPEVLSKVIDDFFNSKDKFASKEANATGWFGGDRTADAERVRAQIQAEKEKAHATLDHLTIIGTQIKARQDHIETTRAQLDAADSIKLQGSLRAAAAAGVSIPGGAPAAAPAAPVTQSPGSSTVEPGPHGPSDAGATPAPDTNADQNKAFEEEGRANAGMHETPPSGQAPAPLPIPEATPEVAKSARDVLDTLNQVTRGPGSLGFANELMDNSVRDDAKQIADTFEQITRGPGSLGVLNAQRDDQIRNDAAQTTDAFNQITNKPGSLGWANQMWDAAGGGDDRTQEQRLQDKFSEANKNSAAISGMTLGDKTKNFLSNLVGGAATGTSEMLKSPMGKAIESAAAGPQDVPIKATNKLAQMLGIPGSIPDPEDAMHAIVAKVSGIDLQPSQYAAQQLDKIPGVITDPAFTNTGSAKAGRFVGGVLPWVAQSAVAPEMTMPLLFSVGYQGQVDAAKAHGADEMTATRAGLIGGSVNMVLGIPFKGAGKVVAGFFGGTSRSVVQGAFEEAYQKGGAPAVAKLLSAWRDAFEQATPGLVDASTGAAANAAKDAAFQKAATDGMQSVIQELNRTILDRAKRAAVTGVRDAAIFGGNTAAQNLVAKENYDPERAISEGVLESAAGGLVFGSLFGALHEAGAAKKAAREKDTFASELAKTTTGKDTTVPPEAPPDTSGGGSTPQPPAPAPGTGPVEPQAPPEPPAANGPKGPKGGAPAPTTTPVPKGPESQPPEPPTKPAPGQPPVAVGTPPEGHPAPSGTVPATPPSSPPSPAGGGAVPPTPPPAGSPPATVTKGETSSGDVTTPPTVDKGAHDAATSPENDLDHPTQAQIEGNNAKLGHPSVAGMDISIQHPEGSTRYKVDEDRLQQVADKFKGTHPKAATAITDALATIRGGEPEKGFETLRNIQRNTYAQHPDLSNVIGEVMDKAWSRKMAAHYGYIKGTESGDGEHLDTFVKPGTPEDYKGPVYVVNSHVEPNGRVDHKAIIGAGSLEEAKQIHDAHYPEALHAKPADIATFSNPETFKAWAMEKARRGPAKGGGKQAPEDAIAEAVDEAHKIDRDNGGTLLGAFQKTNGLGLRGREAQTAAWSLYAAGSERPSITNLHDFIEKTARLEELARSFPATKPAGQRTPPITKAKDTAAVDKLRDKISEAQAEIDYLTDEGEDVPAGQRAALKKLQDELKSLTNENQTTPGEVPEADGSEEDKGSGGAGKTGETQPGINGPISPRPERPPDKPAAAHDYADPAVAKASIEAALNRRAERFSTLGVVVRPHTAADPAMDGWIGFNPQTFEVLHDQAKGAKFMQYAQKGGQDAEAWVGLSVDEEFRHALGFAWKAHEHDRWMIHLITDKVVPRNIIDLLARVYPDDLSPLAQATELMRMRGQIMAFGDITESHIAGRPAKELIEAIKNWNAPKEVDDFQEKVTTMEADPKGSISWRVDASDDCGNSFASNGLRYPSKVAAEAAARDLQGRWMAMTDWRVRPSGDAVNRGEDGKELEPHGATHTPSLPAKTDMSGKESPSLSLARKVSQALTQGSLDRRALTEMAKGSGLSQKQVDEAAELGVVLRAREIVATLPAGSDGSEVFKQLVELYESQPNLTAKTSTSKVNQAYSTPVPLAFATGMRIGMGDAKIASDDTAGNGALTLAAHPKNTIVNEIDPQRAENLQQLGFKQVTRNDATAITTQADRKNLNPPFGTQLEGGEKKSWPLYTSDTGVEVDTPNIDMAIVAKSLSGLTADGKASIIMGGKMGNANERAAGYAVAGTQLPFWHWLYKNFNVTDHFTVAGDLYAKQGARWPVDVIIVEGKGTESALPKPWMTAPPVLDTWQQVGERLLSHESVSQISKPGSKPPGQQPGRPRGSGGVVGPKPAESKPPGVPKPAGGGVKTPAVAPGKPVSGGRGGNPPAGGKPGNEGSGGQGGGGVKPPATNPAPKLTPEQQALKDAVGDLFGSSNPLVAFHGTNSPDFERFDPEKGADREQAGFVGAHFVETKQAAQSAAEKRAKQGGGQARVVSAELGLKNPLSLDGEEPFRLADIPPKWQAKLEPAAMLPARISDDRRYSVADVQARLTPREMTQMVKDMGHDAVTRYNPDAGARTWTVFDAGAIGKPSKVVGSSSPDERNFDTPIPPERMAKMLPAVLSLAAKADTPETFAEAVSVLGPKAHNYVQALWFGAKMGGAKGPDRPDWGSIFKAPDKEPEPKGEEPEHKLETDHIVDLENAFQSTYTPRSKSPLLNKTLVPVNLRDEIEKALDDLEARRGNIDEFAASHARWLTGGIQELHQVLDGGQVDAFALAVDKIMSGTALINGCQTGLGKGRTAASVMTWVQQEGHIPVFFTAGSILYLPMIEDFRDIHAEHMVPMMTNNGATIKNDDGNVAMRSEDAKKNREVLQQIIDTGRLPAGKNVVFTTYSQLGSDQPQGYVKDKRGERARIKNRIPRPDGIRTAMLRSIADKAVFVLDESHNAAGESDTGFRLMQMLMGWNTSNQPVEGKKPVGGYYSSATFSKTADNMPIYAMTDLGKAVPDPRTLPRIFDRGGIAMMQVASAMLARAGQYMRLEMDFTGVNFINHLVGDPATEKDPYPEQYRQADAFTSPLRDIIDFSQKVQPLIGEINKLLAADGEMVDGKLMADQLSGVNFADQIHNMVGQYLLAVKAKATGEEAVKQLAQGRKPFITVENTLEGPYSETIGLGFAPNFQGLLQRYLKKTLDVTRKKADGRTTVSETINLDEHLDNPNPRIRQLAAELKDAFDTHTATILAADIKDLHISPIDTIKEAIEAAGYTMGEITGRKVGIKTDGTTYKRSSTDRSTAGKNRILSKYVNAGKNGEHGFDAMLANRSGSTGISAHAADKFYDKRPRVMDIAQPNSDISIMMQMYGRIFRKGQISLPEYLHLMSQVAAERRLASVLTRKLKSLKANTTSNTSGSEMTDMSDMSNNYGDIASHTTLESHPEIVSMLVNTLSGVLPPRFDQDGTDLIRKNGAFYNKVSGETNILPAEWQDTFYKEADKEWKAIVEEADQMGTNELKVDAMDLKARTMDSEIIAPEVGDTEFESAAHLETVETKAGREPIPHAEVMKTLAENTEPAKEATKNWVSDFTNAQAARMADLQQKQGHLAVWPQIQQQAESRLNRDRGIIADAFRMMGRGVTVDMDGIIATGVVTNVKPDFDAPLLPSRQRIVVHINTSKRTITVAATQARRLLTETSLEEAQLRYDSTVNRSTRRHIVTGNVIAGWDALANQNAEGKIITFTDSNNKVRTGILMPQSYNPGAAMAKIKTLDQLQRALASSYEVRTPSGLSIRNVGGFVNAQTVEVRAPSARNRGGKYWREAAFNRLLQGGEMRQQGSDMVATMSTSNLPGLLAFVNDVTKEQLSYTIPPRTQGSSNPMRGASNPTRSLKETIIEKTPGLDGLSSLLTPSMKSEAHLNAAITLRGALGPMNKTQEEWNHKLEPHWWTFEKLGVKREGLPIDKNPGLKFMSDRSTGAAMTPEMQAINDEFDRMEATLLAQAKAAGAELQTIRENYQKGAWTPESRRAFNAAMAEAMDKGIIPKDYDVNAGTKLQKAAVKTLTDKYLSEGKGGDDNAIAYLARRPLKGGESFRKGKVFKEDHFHALEHGLVSFSNNPVEVEKLLLAEMSRSIMGNRALRAFEKSGDITTEEGLFHPPIDDYVKLADRYGEIWGGKNVPVWKVMREIAKSAKKDLFLAGFGKDIFADPALKDELNALEWQTPKGPINIHGMHTGTGRSYSELVIEKLLEDHDAFEQQAPGIYAKLETIANSKPKLREILDTPTFNDLEQRLPVGGRVLKGYRYARKPVADVLNNYLSSSLYNNKHFGTLYKGWMAFAAALNQTQLGAGLSFFHAAFVTAEAQITGVANVLQDVYGVARGNRSVTQLLHTLKQGATATWDVPMTGDQVLNAWRDPDGVINPRIAQVVEALQMVGAGFTMERGMQTDQYHKAVSDVLNGKRLKAIGRSPVAAMEVMAHWIMQGLVPRQKAGVFAHMVWRIIEQNPGKSLKDLAPEFNRAWNDVDARLGQVRYDRLFMHNIAKNMLQGTIRAPGWSGGTIAQLGGAVKDTYSFFDEWARTGKMPQDLPPRVAYTMGLLILTTTLNAALTYLFTGDKPEGLDYFAFRSGGTDEHGNPERFVLPTYVKDLVAYSHDPMTTLANKMHPALSLIHDLWVNKDYYGTQITNADDGALKKAYDRTKYVAKAFEPFWSRGLRREHDRGGSPAKMAAPMIGVMPAPKSMTQTAAERLAGEYSAAAQPVGGRTQAAADKSAAEAKLVEQIRHRETPDFMPAIKAGYITADDIPKLRARASISPLQATVKRLELPQAESVYRLANPKEKAQLTPIMVTKRQNALDKKLGTHTGHSGGGTMFSGF